MGKILEKNSSTLYFLFRVLIGIGFLLHGIMKLPGILEGTTPFFSLFWLAGIIETLGGVFLIIGFVVRPTAFVTGMEMLFAYFYMHVASKGTLNPLKNGGEAAMLFFAAFLVLMSQGAGKWGIDRKKSR
ncbi:DoxX family protein [Candidatus Pacearchaeota archaeon]|nr:DoxX family protein [Candidatus Pacearchaeota archaeon]